MPRKRGGQPGDVRHGQSAVTNGSVLFEGADGRSAPARRMRDLIQLFTVELGTGDLTSSEEMIVANAAMARMKSEDLRSRMAAGEAVSDEDVVRVGRLSSLAVRDLNTAKSKRVAANPGLSPLDRIAAEIAARRDQPVEIEDEEDDGNYEPVPGFDDMPEPIVESVQTPSAPEPIAADVFVAEPAKPQGPLSIVFDPRPRTPIDPVGSTLPQLIGALLAEGYPAATLVRVKTPADEVSATLADAVQARNAGVLASRAQWFVR